MRQPSGIAYPCFVTDVVMSRTGMPLRLTDERWQHIVSGHPEMAGRRAQTLETIASATSVLLGSDGAHLAYRIVEPGKALVAVYREIPPSDGFVIAAFLTRRLRTITRRIALWPPKN